MAYKSREPNHTRGSSTSRMARGFARMAACVVVLSGLTAALGAQGGDKTKVVEAVKSDLARLATLERTWYEKNRAFTTDLRALAFTPTSGANIVMSYASARSWAANASHKTLQPMTCFIVGQLPSGQATPEKPFCTEPTESRQVAAVPATPAPRQQPAAAQDKPAARPVPAPQVTAPKPAVPRQQPVVSRRSSRRAAGAGAVATTILELPARAPSSGAALANTRAAGGVADAGVTEAVSPSQFTERLNAIVASALDMMNAKMPELARDPYESSTEYQTRVAQAYAAFQRRETEFYARNTRMYVVSIPVRDVRYDADREVVEFAVDPMALPTTHSFAAADGARLSVACYTRPYFWCSRGLPCIDGIAGQGCRARTLGLRHALTPRWRRRRV